VKKGRHRRYEEARALKRGPDLDIEDLFTDLREQGLNGDSPMKLGDSHAGPDASDDELEDDEYEDKYSEDRYAHYAEGD
jgi:hypothetical protein